jgi:hypothetical protein
MQLEIEETALKKEIESFPPSSLKRIQEELANLREAFNEMKARLAK